MSDNHHWISVGVMLGLMVFSAAFFGVYTARREAWIAAIHAACALANGAMLIRRIERYAYERTARVLWQTAEEMARASKEAGQ